MCETRYYVGTFPKDRSRKGSKAVDVYTFQTVFREGKRSQEAYAVTIGLEEAQLILTVDFWRTGILAIETQISAVKGSSPRLDDILTEELLRKIEEEVPLDDQDPSARQQLMAYVRSLPSLLETCCNREPEDRDCRAALKRADEVLQPVEH